MLLYSVGSSLLDRDALLLRRARPAVVAYRAGTDADPKPAPTPWSSIAPGKPLTIDIREVYTGKHPGKRTFASSQGMLLSTAAKGYVDYDAQAMALNLLKRRVERQSRIFRPAPGEDGCPVVYHSPAVVQRSLSLEVCLVFDSFPEQAFLELAGAMRSSAAVPLFVTQGPYVLAASEVMRLAGRLGEMLFDGRPVLRETVAIDLELPGAVPATAGFLLVVPGNVDQLDPRLRRDFALDVSGKLVDPAQRPYNGEVPYVVLAVDGSQREDLAEFAPRAVSASLLSRFLGVKEGRSLPLGPLQDALQLYNDFRYRQEYERVSRQIGQAEGDHRQRLQGQLAALRANIGNALLHPPREGEAGG